MGEDCWCELADHAERLRPRSLPQPALTQAFWIGFAAAMILGGAFAITMVVLIGSLL